MDRELAHSKQKIETDTVYKVAETPAERRSAFCITYESYVRTGLSKANQHQLRVTPFHLLSTTNVLIARLAKQTILTLSLVQDGQLGLPMEIVYAQEVQRSRDLGLKVAEVTCLADRCIDRHQFFGVFCELSRLTAQFARHQGIDQLMAVVHPKHARFYQRYLGFEPIGGLTECPHVLNRPAVALCLDFGQIDRNPPACYDRFFGVRVTSDQLQPHPITASECHAMAGMVDASFQVLSSAAMPLAFPAAAIPLPLAV